MGVAVPTLSLEERLAAVDADPLFEGLGTPAEALEDEGAGSECTGSTSGDDGSADEAATARRPRRARVGASGLSRRQVIGAASTLHQLADRVGHVPEGGAVPRAVLRQKWSALNVPLMRAAASTQADCAVLRYLSTVVSDLPRPVVFAGNEQPAADALLAGWLALRAAMRHWGVHGEADFAHWLHQQGFPSPQPERHFSGRAQERVLHQACLVDARAAGLEAVYVAAVLHLGRQPQAPRPSATLHAPRPQAPATFEAEGPRRTPLEVTATPTASGSLPPRVWQQLESVDLAEVLRTPARTVRDPPRWFRGGLLKAYGLALREWARSPSPAAWKLVVLVPRMLLSPTEEKGEAGKTVFNDRLRRFERGEWLHLLAEAGEGKCTRRDAQSHDEEVLAQKRAEQVEGKVRLREVSRARVQLTSLGLAPGTKETLEELTDPALRPPRLSEQVPEEVLAHQPSQQVKLDPDALLAALRSAGRGSAADLAGTRYEHLRVLLEDEELWGIFAKLCQAFARADVPEEVSSALRLGRMTALKKDTGRVRGIVAGSVLRRLTCKAVVAQYSDAFLAATAPYQFALQTRAGTEALAHILRYLSDADEDAVVVSLDGVGAFDHVKRAAFMSKVRSDPRLEALLPLVRMLYGSESRFLWTDASGATHEILQGEGGEQGCPLMPALFALAQHDALAAADRDLQSGERLLSFLDDLYLVTTRARAHTAFREVADHVERVAGVRTHLGKLRAWCRGGGPAPVDLAAASPSAWTADKPAAENGLVVLGTPLGTREFVEAHANERMEKEMVLLERLSDLSDLQCKWVLLSQSAVPRANHSLRILPPSLSRRYAEAHDQAVWSAFCTTFGASHYHDDAAARNVSTLPGRMGGLGLRSASRTAEGAYWASWVDAIHVMSNKAPDVADAVQAELGRAGGSTVRCLRELQECRGELLRAGALDLPTWAAARQGAKPPPACDGTDAADLDRGWQCHVCSFSENLFLEQVVRPSSDAARLALLRSQAGGPASAFLRAVPSEPAYTLTPLRLQVAVRRRLRWPLPMATRRCGRTCTHELDDKGDRAAACQLSGRLKLRSRPVEKTWARVLREAGARVRENVFLRSTTLPGIDPSDGRHIEIVATGLPVCSGVPLAVDATVVSPLQGDGTPRPRAAQVAGVALATAEANKRRT